MRPVDAGSDHGTRFVFAEDQPEYAQLPARVQLPFVTTRWTLDDEEREAVKAGGDIVLRLMTFGKPLQPIGIFVAGLEERDHLPVYSHEDVAQLLNAMRDILDANPDAAVQPVADATGKYVGVEVAPSLAV